MPAGLLLHFDGDFVDTYRGRDLATYNALNPPIVSAIAKFGSGAMYVGARVAGTTEFIGDFDFGDGDFTITYQIIVDDGTNQGGRIEYNNGSTVWACVHSLGESAPRPRLILGATAYNPTTYLYPIGVYVHIAWVRLDGILTLYADGVVIQQWGSTPSLGGGAGALTITGAFSNNTAIDELLILKSAFYTAAFEPPTAAYPDSTPPAPLEPSDPTMPTHVGQSGGGNWITGAASAWITGEPSTSQTYGADTQDSIALTYGADTQDSTESVEAKKTYEEVLSKPAADYWWLIGATFLIMIGD